MIQNSNPTYIRSFDGTRLFVNANFKTDEKNLENVVIFNYGLLCSNEHWKYQIPYFDKLGFKIIMHDYRCHFNSSGNTNIKECTFENISKDIAAIIDHYQIKSCYMLGHSMGVNVTLESAKNINDKIKGLVLISGTVFPPQDVMFNSNIMELATPALKFLSDKYPTFYKMIWKTGYKNPIARQIVYSGGFNTDHTDPEFIEIYMKKMSELPEEMFLHLMEQMREHNIITDLENIKVPTLIIGGDKDKIIPNYLQNILKDKLKNSELYIVKDGSHVPQVDYPALINSRIEHFFKKGI